MFLNARNSGSKRLTSKHLLAVYGYSSFRKVLNLLLCEAERIVGKTDVRAKPYIATIDLSSACNLSCPSCPTGLGIKGRAKANLERPVFDAFLREAGPYLYIAHLYNWGEPLLNRDAARIVSKLKHANVFTSMSSHLSFRNIERVLQVCEAGLDHLIVSLDGFSADSYSKYRIGGNFHRVMSNTEQLAALKQKSNTFKTIIEWQMIDFPHLQGEIARARAHAAEMGIDRFRVIPAYTNRLSKSPSRCASLWRNIVLQSDGGLAPCCKIFDETDDFGSMKNGAISAMRRGTRSHAARSLMKRSCNVDLVDPAHPCLRCNIAQSQPHLRHLAPNEEGLSPNGLMGLAKATNLRDQG